jgi:hypothetical protein
MSVSRRTVLKSVATAGAASALPVIASAKGPSLVIFDSRIPESKTFAKRARNALDVAALDATHWVGLRRDFQGIKRVEGVTGWSDWVLVRGFLEEQGLRLVSESRLPAPRSGMAHLFQWTMG